MKRYLSLFPVLLSAAGLAACGGGGSSSDDSQAKAGTIVLGITDAPVDAAESVVVQFTGIQFVPADAQDSAEDDGDDVEGTDEGTGEGEGDEGEGDEGESGGGQGAGGPPDDPGPPADAGNPADGGPDFLTIEFETPKTIDLLALQGTARDFLLDGEALPAGQYSQIRLLVQAEQDGVFDSYIVVDGEQYELRIPSGSETGLKLVHDFAIDPDTTIDFTIDFDLRRSVVYAPGQGYMLKPVLRLVETEQTGAIAGTIDPAVFAELTCSEDPEVGYGVYVYAGPGAVPDDLGSAAAPLVTADVQLDDNSNYAYTVGFLEAGDYTVAVTCQADLDDPETDDDIGFAAPVDATVTPGGTTTVDFQ